MERFSITTTLPHIGHLAGVADLSVLTINIIVLAERDGGDENQARCDKPVRVSGLPSKSGVGKLLWSKLGEDPFRQS